MGQSFAAVQGDGHTALSKIKDDSSRSVFLLTQDQTLNQPTPAQSDDCAQWSDAGDDISDKCCNDTTMTWANVESCAASNAGKDGTANDSVNGLKADLIFWRIGAQEDQYVQGGPVNHTETKPSLEDDVVGQAHSAFYSTPSEDYVKSARYMPGAGYACLPTVGKPDMQGLYSFQCTSNCADLWANRPQNVPAVANSPGSLYQASPDYSPGKDSSETLNDVGSSNTNYGYMNRSSFMQSVNDNICHTMMVYSDMDNPAYPSVQAGNGNELKWPGLSVWNDTFNNRCGIEDFNATTVSDDNVGQCPEVVKSPGYMAVHFAAHGDKNDKPYSGS